MSTHDNPMSLFTEVIEEYLSAAKICLTTQKTDSGVHGYPATLLLFCAVEAIGNNLCTNQKTQIGITKHEPFRVLKHERFNLSPRPTDIQIKHLEEWFRNQLAHRGLLMDGVALSPEESAPPFTFNDEDEPNTICVPSFYKAVNDAWKRIDKSLFEPSIDAQKRRPTTPATILFSGCATASGATSTCSQPASGAPTLPEEPSSKSEDGA